MSAEPKKIIKQASDWKLYEQDLLKMELLDLKSFKCRSESPEMNQEN